MRARGSLVSLVLVVCTFSPTLLAQKGPATGGGGAPKTPTAIPSRPTSPIPQQQQPLMMIYNGKVHIQGPPLQDSVKVVARCYGGRAAGAIYSAYTDMKGNFSLTFGQGQSIAPMDASVDPIDPVMSMGRTNTQMQCEITAMAAGYISSQMTVQFRSSLDSTEMGKLVLTPIGGTQDLGGIVSVTSLSAPQGAQHEYAKGVQDLRDNKFDKAEKHFRKATDEFPKYAVAWEKIGQLDMQAQNREDARTCFQKAIEADPKYVPPYLMMATLNAEDSKWDSVLEITNHAINIDGQHFAHAYFLNSAAYLNTGNLAAAEKSGLRAEELDKQHVQPRIQLLLAEIFSRTGRVAVAAAHFRKFLELAPNSSEAEAVRTKLAKLEVAASK
jgi:tetratricopeptide (TPR) repeat protein